MRHSQWVVALVAATCLLGAVPALADGPTQLDARDEPTVAGPLAVEGKQCRDSKQKFGDETVAKGSVCLTIFALDPTTESDEARDHGVLWVQSSVWTASGWCTAKVQTDILVPSQMETHALGPAPEVIDEKARTTVTLRTDANGSSDNTSTVSADLILYPGEITRPAQPDPEPDAGADEDLDMRLRLTWTGLENRKLAFASAAEVSWPAGSEIPAVSYRIRYPVKKTTC